MLICQDMCSVSLYQDINSVLLCQDMCSLSLCQDVGSVPLYQDMSNVSLSQNMCSMSLYQDPCSMPLCQDMCSVSPCQVMCSGPLCQNILQNSHVLGYIQHAFVSGCRQIGIKIYVVCLLCKDMCSFSWCLNIPSVLLRQDI